MRIAMIGQKGIPVQQGGVERHVEELSRALVSAGHMVRVYGRTWFTQRTDGRYDGIELKHTAGIKTKHLDAITHSFTALLHAMYSGVDVIHFHAVGPSLLSWIPRLFTPHILVVSTFHCIDRKHDKWGWFAKLMLWIGEWSACKFPHQTIAVSKTIRQYIRDTYSKEATYIPNGVPLYIRTTTTTTLDAFDIMPKQYILVVSRLIAHKAVHHTIAAFIKAKINKAIAGHIKLVIVGGGHYTDSYEAYLNSLSIGRDDIIFTGTQYDGALSELYSHAGLYIHTSLNEGMPITVLEAMSYGLPIVVSDIPEHCELIRDEAFQCRVGNISDIAKKMASVFNTDAVEKEKIGTTFTQLVAREFNWGKISQETVSVYNEAQRIPTDLQTQVV
jgi:glycosyltransferase involved in cell wall biosynthesis